MGHLYTTPALRLHTKAHTGYTTRQCIYSPRYIQYALRHVVFCYSFAWMSIRTLSFNADIFFFFPFRYSYFFLLLEKILFFSSIIVISFVLFFRRNERSVRRSKLLNRQLDTFSSPYNFVRSIREKNGSRNENYLRLLGFSVVRSGKDIFGVNRGKSGREGERIDRGEWKWNGFAFLALCPVESRAGKRGGSIGSRPSHRNFITSNKRWSGEAALEERPRG